MASICWLEICLLSVTVNVVHEHLSFGVSLALSVVSRAIVIRILVPGSLGVAGFVVWCIMMELRDEVYAMSMEASL